MIRSPGSVFTIRAASAGVDKSMVCHVDTYTSSADLTCNTVTRNGDRLALGLGSSMIYQGAIKMIGLVPMGTGNVVCYLPKPASSRSLAKCVRVAATSSGGSEVIAQTDSDNIPKSSANDVIDQMRMVAHTATNKAFLCSLAYPSSNTSNGYVHCSVASESGAGGITFSQAIAVAAPSAIYVEFDVALLRADAISAELLVCYDTGRQDTTCKVLGWTSAGGFTEGAGVVHFTWASSGMYIHLKAIGLGSTGEALVCAEQGMGGEYLWCSVIQGSTSSLREKTTYTLRSNFGGFDLLDLGSGKAALCYEQETPDGDMRMNAKCRVLTVGATVTAGPDLMFVQGQMGSHVDMTRVSDGFIICYDYSTDIYLPSTWHTKCDLIKIAADGNSLVTTATVMMASAGQAFRQLSVGWFALFMLSGVVALWQLQ